MTTTIVSPYRIKDERRTDIDVLSAGASSTHRNRNKRNPQKPYRILSIDGGGIRGILPATIIWYMEEALKSKSGNSDARISDYFDLIAGTSTGGILSCVYLTPDPERSHRPKLKAKDALDLYVKDGPKIFSTSFSRRLKTLGGLWRQRYCALALEAQLMEVLGANTMMSELIKPCIIPAYDIIAQQAVFFKSHEAGSKGNPDFKAWQIARATSAAPSYFAPVKLDSPEQKHALIDGALFARNPALWALLEANQLKANEVVHSKNEVVMVSIGTGSCQRPFSAKNMHHKGAIAWIKPMLGIMLNTRAEMVSQQLKQMLDSDPKTNYYRIDPCLYKADARLDNVSPTNLTALHEAGLRYVEQNKTWLDGIIDQLMV